MHEPVGGAAMQCQELAGTSLFNASVSREQRDLNSRILFTSRAGLPPVGFVLVGYSEAIVNWRKIAISLIGIR
ncbi:MAG: hypothetical protein DMG78_15865 [Acidobacteria bacterium]|nr:MAG: hypothetical protein DMG78_15865 [Acidobacteriota bacterium]